MRDFRDAKAMAQTIREAFASKGLKLTVAESLELIARAFGVLDWNTLAASIKAAEAHPDELSAAARPLDSNAALDGLARALGLEDWDKLKATIQAARPSTPPAAALEPPPRPRPFPQAAGHVGFSATLEATLHTAAGLAAVRKHGYTTLEHLLLALVDDTDAADVMRACQVDLDELKQDLTSYIDDELKNQVTGDGEDAKPTAGFHRVIQRAVIHVRSAGRDEVTGANVLVAIFSERESQAANFLQQQKLTRYDAVNFIAHGVRKDGGRAA